MNRRFPNGLVAVTRPNRFGNGVMTVVAAMDAGLHAPFLASLQYAVGLYSLIAVAISALFAAVAARRGLAPLHHMRTKVADVSARRLTQRMSVDSVPIEMAALAQELNQMLDRLQDGFQRLWDFSSDLAHELRTPITNLLTQTQVALSADRDAVTYRGILASNAEELQRLGRMISDMLYLARTEERVGLPSRGAIAAAREVRALLEFYDVLAQERGVTLSLQGDGKILGDQLMFRRAISNLLSNAVRHANDGGVVDVTVREVGESVRISVSNTGEEIDPRVLPKLFDRFYRADASRSKQESDGVGLGLAITRAIVEAHGGSIEAESSDGRTRFTVSFPKARC